MPTLRQMVQGYGTMCHREGLHDGALRPEQSIKAAKAGQEILAATNAITKLSDAVTRLNAAHRDRAECMIGEINREIREILS